MKYIKGIEIIETPKIVEIEGVSLELSDEQLRQMGYTPLDEVVMAQAEILGNIIPSAIDIKEKLIDSMTVVIPEGGLPYKLGYSWEPKIVANNIIFESVRDENAIGTNKAPIIFAEYVLLIPNAFYLYEGNLYVYVGSEGKADDWDSCKDYMELM